MKKKILFINPSDRYNLFEAGQMFSLPPYNLMILASLTPDRYDVQVIDEAVSELTLMEDADFVAVTAMTNQAERAYKICTAFRQRGIPVMIGGIHASMVTDEAKQYADSILIGEAEEIWPTILEDFDNGQLKELYEPSDFPDLSLVPDLRRDLVDIPKYSFETVQSTRGCPNNCHFCSVTRFNGGKHRLRPVKDVINEIKSLKSKKFIFLDDNLVGTSKVCRNHALELFAAMKDLDVKWGSQVCIDIVEDERLLKAAAMAGGIGVYVGFESVEKMALQGMNKKINLRSGSKNFKDSIQKFHDHGIAVAGGFIFGNDTDTRDIFKKTVDFMRECKLDCGSFAINTPLPGTALYKKLEEENRLLYTNFPEDWNKYTLMNVVFKPKNMTPDELLEGYMWAYKQISGPVTSFSRFAKSLFRTGGNLPGAVLAFFWGFRYYHLLKKYRKYAD